MLSGLLVQVAHAADETRRSSFPNVLVGTWAETAQQCAAKDKSNVVIEPAKYGDGDGELRGTLDRSVGGIARHQLRSACPLHQRVAAGEDPNQKHHRAAAWPRSRGDGTNVRRFKELSALSITIAPFVASILRPAWRVVSAGLGSALLFAGVLTSFIRRR